MKIKNLESLKAYYKLRYNLTIEKASFVLMGEARLSY